MISEGRSVSGWTQFVELFKRNSTYLLRNPATIRMTFVNAAFIALLVLALFFKVADIYLGDDIFFDKTRVALYNWVGLSFMMTNNIMMPSILNVVLQMPLQVPVFKREIMNRMYTPTAYYFARIISGMLVQLCQPLILTFIVFFGLGEPITFENFVNFLTGAMQLTLVGCGVGYFCGVLVDDDNIARGITTFFTLCFMLVSGGLNSAATYPPVVDQMQYISPNRYALEIFFRVLSDQKVYPFPLDESNVLTNLGFNRGLPMCHLMLGVLFLLYIGAGWAVIVFRNRNF
jgi:hypothetical protein